jgi:hypothetical protein
VTLDDRLENIRRAYERSGLKLGVVASQESVAAFERKYTIDLPEEYRRFVLEVGNGGDGPPYYGMFRIEDADHDETGRIDDGYAPHLDFPLTNAWIWEDKENADEALLNQVHAWGHIYLGTDGCGIQHVLITKGAERGNVWMIAGEGAHAVFVETIFAKKRRYTFLEWLETWLENNRVAAK